jgi:hypothetical protein
MAHQQSKLTSIEPRSTTSLSEVTWHDINEPGSYVEVGSGDLYRFPKEALMQGASPLVRKESSGASRLEPISKSLTA